MPLDLSEHLYVWAESVAFGESSQPQENALVRWFRRMGALAPATSKQHIDRLLVGFQFGRFRRQNVHRYSRKELKALKLRRVARLGPEELEGTIESLQVIEVDAFLQTTGDSRNWMHSLLTSDPNIKCVYHGPAFLECRRPTFEIATHMGSSFPVCGEDWIGVIQVRPSDLLVSVFARTSGKWQGSFDCYSPAGQGLNPPSDTAEMTLEIPAPKADDMELRDDEKEEFRKFAPLLEAIPRAKDASLLYEMIGGTIQWTDEWKESVYPFASQGLRMVLAYRTSLNLDKPRTEFEPYWIEAQRRFPRWIGFLPSRCSPDRELQKFYQRESVIW